MEDGAVLTVEVNDMGKYGCFPDCAEMMSKPLSAKATTNLIRRWPMSSSVAHSKLLYIYILNTRFLQQDTLSSGLLFTEILINFRFWKRFLLCIAS